MISCDYTFMTVNSEDDGRAKPILVMKDSRTTSVAATFVDAKGPTPYAVKYFSNFLKTLGYKRVLFGERWGTIDRCGSTAGSRRVPRVYMCVDG